MEKTMQINGAEQVLSIFGSFDEHAKLIEQAFDVKLLNRDTDIRIIGEPANIRRAEKVIYGILALLERGEGIQTQNVSYLISLVESGEEEQLASFGSDCILITSKGRPIKAKTVGQQKYMDAISKNTIVFGIGPAGTGKTYLAVAAAVAALRKKTVSRIILTRPAVEAGEKLGFLPGDLQNKVDPYLRPLYDALYEMMGADTFQSCLEKGIVEVAPLAYMRGRTLDESFIILDEAQNTSEEQMKMFLTRLGFNSKVIVTGDVTQVDLPDGRRSGLRAIIPILSGVEDIAFAYLDHRDVVRHQLVQRIIAAYEKYEKKKAQKKRG